MPIQTYKFRPAHRTAKVIAKAIQKSTGFKTEMFEIAPNVYLVNQTDKIWNGGKDSPIFIDKLHNRNERIAREAKRGDLTYKEIGEIHGISKQRVRQIVAREEAKKNPRKMNIGKDYIDLKLSRKR